MTSIPDFAQVLVRPIVSEKSLRLQEQGQYSFEVSLKANKGLVKQAVEHMFGVDVVRVNVMNMKGKRKHFRMRLVEGRDWKKAIVTLKPGQKIQIFEGM
ncbi:MAG: 50S ribosomal protein L23 [Chloroflexi bacterium]|nr:50S ribosomal protein L23 [Chloroflexota bacterium]